MTAIPTFQFLTLTRQDGNIFVITLQNPPENRLTKALCQDVIQAFRYVQNTLTAEHKPSPSDSQPSAAPPGAIVTTSTSRKFFCNGLDLHETSHDPFANTDGFYPMLHTILDFPWPTVACITGHTFGGACPLALAHDYRVMNSDRGFFCMPPVDLGLHFDGIGALPRAKLPADIARQMLLEAYRWTGKQALEDGIVDAIAGPEEMMDVAMEYARRWAPKGKGGVYGLLRAELVGEALQKLAAISYVRRRKTNEHL
ncbi:MAG: hypothetical protein M1828_001263 [Chrysothrix sp. TS-e1954]|nr:MAG: hypothetical protein M1828_001263 [Chrysothrix sp. TS-e1954]